MASATAMTANTMPLKVLTRRPGSPLWTQRPKTLIHTSGMAVGLPEGQMGNSEVGHMTLGAGRVVYQNFTRINKAIADGDFFSNPVYCDAIDRPSAAAMRYMLWACCHLVACTVTKIILTRCSRWQPSAARKKSTCTLFSMVATALRAAPNPRWKKLRHYCRNSGSAKSLQSVVAFMPLIGDNRWDRVTEAYNLITTGEATYRAEDPIEALQNAYARDENDEFVRATAIVAAGESPTQISDGDAVIFMNFRPDRAREIAHALTDSEFEGFERAATPKLSTFVQTTEYQDTINAPCAYPPISLVNSLGDYLASQGKRQLRIAETEKYAHVTFFFSGGRESLYAGEERILVPSPQIATYDSKPEMSAPEVTEKLVAAIGSGKFDTIICNYANCDQVGHTGNFEASVKAVEAVDNSLAQVVAAIEKAGGEILITADHGNVEEMFDEANNQPPHPAHYSASPAGLCG